MDFFSTIFYFIVAIFILVTVHEFGHFAAAKFFGMRVEKFYVGFDFWNLRLWRTQRGETEYGLGAIPLGGYVKISGIIDESFDTDFESKPPQPWEFRSKPVWQRIIVLSAGVIMNMVLAAAIFISLAFMYGEAKTPIVTGSYVQENSVFANMGMQSGDVIVAVNGKPVKYWDEALDPEIFTNSNLTYSVRRNGQVLVFQAPQDIMSQMNRDMEAGIRPMTPPLIGEVYEGYPADKAGLKPGALLVSIAGEPIFDWQQVLEKVSKNKSNPIEIQWRIIPGETGSAATISKIKQNGALKTATLTPNEDGKIGIILKQVNETQYTSLGFFGALTAGVERTWKMTALTLKGFGKIISGQEDIRESVGGPIKIAKLAGQSAEQGAGSFLMFLALLSISLAILNILPIPALDGGQIVINAIEGIMGRELPLKIKLRVQQIGVTALMILIAFIILNDIFHP
jgi:regulator of sigma E protease